MQKIFKKLCTFALIISVFISLTPFAFAQTETLDIIKEKLTTGEDSIAIIDYSENIWGRLSERVYKALESEGYEGFKQMYEDLNTDDYVDGAPFTGETDFTIQDFYEGKCMGDNGLGRRCMPDEIPKLQEAINNLRSELSNIEYTFEYTMTDRQGNVQEITETGYFSNNDLDMIIDEIFAYRFSGERQLRDTLRTVAVVMRNIIGFLAIIWIIISGVRMVLAGGDESIITEQKRSIIYAIIGLVVILLIERLIDIIYGPAGTFRTELDTATTAAFSLEVYGVINFIKAIMGSIAIFMIVLSGFRTIFAYGEEEEVTKQRKTIMWVVIGLVLLLIDEIVVEQLFIMPVQYHDQIQVSNVTAVINTMGRVMQFILGFVGLIALGMLIYGAGMMIANYGNEEMVQQSKKIIKNAIIGIIVIISAYTIVATLVVFR